MAQTFPRPLSVAVQRIRFHPRFYWFVTAALALTTALLVGGSLQRAETSRRSWGDSAEVLVLRRAVAAGEPLHSDDLTRARLPLAALPNAELAAEAIGLAPVADLAEGEILLANRLAARGVVGPSAQLSGTRRGVAIAWRRGMLEVARGDVVDLFAIADSGGSAGIADSGGGVALVASAVVVLSRSPDQVTVAVAGDDVVPVVAAAARGEISLVLANR